MHQIMQHEWLFPPTYIKEPMLCLVTQILNLDVIDSNLLEGEQLIDLINTIKSAIIPKAQAGNFNLIKKIFR